mmetsp:Transcript_15995/g.41372  ORF Transcript_15995/g.41372 Transcript_15995/m.41372 type:complete len:222 (-) Transcript_15995:250-915(-)
MLSITPLPATRCVRMLPLFPPSSDSSPVSGMSCDVLVSELRRECFIFRASLAFSAFSAEEAMFTFRRPLCCSAPWLPSSPEVPSESKPRGFLEDMKLSSAGGSMTPGSSTAGSACPMSSRGLPRPSDELQDPGGLAIPSRPPFEMRLPTAGRKPTPFEETSLRSPGLPGWSTVGVAPLLMLVGPPLLEFNRAFCRRVSELSAIPKRLAGGLLVLVLLPVSR